VPFFVAADEGAEEDYWICSMNTWDPERASCEAPQDQWDPSLETTLATTSGAAGTGDAAKSFEIGSWHDVMCHTNRIYYEGQVKDVMQTEEGTTDIHFHFRGWSVKYDEWIDSNSERIQPHNLYTNSECKLARDQEKWQGVDMLEESKNKKSSKTKKRKAPAAKTPNTDAPPASASSASASSASASSFSSSSSSKKRK